MTHDPIQPSTSDRSNAANITPWPVEACLRFWFMSAGLLWALLLAPFLL